mgnify:CR=1 FL=1
MSVFVATTSFAVSSSEPLDKLRDAGYKVDVNNWGRKLNEEELLKALSNCSGVIAGTEVYSAKVLEMLNKLKVISRLGVGFDNIDILASEKEGIKVFTTETSPAPAVAELTLGLILDVLRKITFHNNQMKAGTWKKNMGFLLSGKTLGIIGLGTIGKKLVEITKGMNLDYIAFDKLEDNNFVEENKVKYCSFDDLIKKSDILSIHLSLSDKTRGLIDSNALEKMKPTAVLINTSRGECINEDALIKALDEKLLAGAGLDVYSNEPYKGSLLEYDNVICTPHIGAYAREIRVKMEIEAVENLIKGLANE